MIINARHLYSCQEMTGEEGEPKEEKENILKETRIEQRRRTRINVRPRIEGRRPITAKDF